MATSAVQMGTVDLLGDSLVRPSSFAPSLTPGYPTGVLLGWVLAVVWAVLG